MPKGVVVILTGASSVGKGAIRDRLLNDPELKLFNSVSVTTRPAKAGEEDGKDYYFVTHKEFAKSIRDKELLEYAEFNGYYYGTPKAQVEFLTNKGKNVLIEVEAQGANQLKMNCPDSVSFFVMPASFEELESQITNRYKDDAATIDVRLNKAKMEMELAPLFRNIVYNNDTDKAVEFIRNTILSEIMKRAAK